MWVFLVLMLLTATAAATDRYASPSGAGSACTNIATPCALTTAIGQMTAGDTTYARGGTYTLANQVTLSAVGSSGNLYKLYNYPGETPILDGSTMSQSFQRGFYLDGGSWWHVKGFEITQMPAFGVYLETGAHDNIIECNNVHHNGRLQATSGGITVGGGAAGNNLILNNDAHHQGGTSSGGDGISAGPAGASGTILRGNRTWRNVDDGVDLSGGTGVLVEDSWSWENGLDDSLNKTSGNGVGFKLGLGQTTDGTNTARRNVAWNNAEAGFSDNHATLANTLYNNTGYDNANPTYGGANHQFDVFDAKAHVLRNNLAANPNTVGINAAAVHDHNSWDSSPAVTVTAADFVSTSFTANLGTRQADCSLPVSTFLTLAPGSDLIDKGVNVGLSFTGSAPDLGAYEFSAAAATAPSNLRVLR